MIVIVRGRQVQREENLKIVDRLRALRETQIGAFIPVLLALVAIWGYFGLVIPLQDLLTGETENFRAIFDFGPVYLAILDLLFSDVLNSSSF